MADCKLSLAVIRLAEILKLASEAGKLDSPLAGIGERRPDVNSALPYVAINVSDEEFEKVSDQEFCAHLTLELYLDGTDPEMARRASRNLTHDIRKVLTRSQSLKEICQLTMFGPGRIVYADTPSNMAPSKLVVKVQLPLTLKYKEEW